MGSLLAALATIVLGALALLLAVPHFIEWNGYRSQFEAQAAKLFGRPVAIQGNIDLTILPVPRLSIRGLTVADEFGKFDQPFAEIEEFNAVLALPSLLQGTIEADRVKLDQPIIRLKIDEFGEGSWQSLGPAAGLNIPVPVRDVVLNEVTIKDGAIELRRELAAVGRFDRISGTFSADSLSGPFKFSGTGAFAGGQKEVKLAAVRTKDKPALRVKGSLRSLDGVSLYQIDGEVKGLDGPFHYEGPVAARLALDAKAKTAVTGTMTEAMPGKAIEMRATAKITLDEAKLDQISLTMTQNDRPQSVTGWAHASWGAKPRLDLAIEANFLDIDQMLREEGRDEAIMPTAVLGALPHLFEGWPFKPQQGQIEAKIQQANLGGDVVEGIHFVASHDREGWKVDTLVARLPGDTDADVTGALPAGQSLAFNGKFELKGRNLSRLMRWSAPSLGVVETGDLANFSLSSSMTFSPEQLSFRNARGSLGTSSFTGDLVHDYGAASRLLLALESDELDLRTLYAGRDGGAGGDGGQLDPTKIPANWTAETVPARKTTLFDVLATVFKADQSNVSLSVSKLQLPDFEARDVRTAFRYEKGTFDFRELNVASTDGLNVKASGRISGIDSKPNGSLKLTVDAPSAQSVTNLARLTGLHSMTLGARRRIEALSPFQLSGSLNAVAAQSSMKLTLAGTAGGSELTFNGQMRGNFEQFGDANINIDGGIGNADGRRLIAQLAPEVPLDKASEAGAGFLKIAAMGAVKSGLASKIQLQTPQARGQFEGEISLLAEPAWGLSGDLEMRASRAATALSMLRLSPGGTPVTGPIDLRATIRKKASQYQVSQLDLTIGGENIRGTADIDTAGERPSAKIDINAASVSVPKVAAYLVDWDREDLTAQIAEVASGLSGIWPERSFALASLQAVDGTLQLKAPVFAMADGVQLANGALKASLSGGTLTLNNFKGDVYGGTATASGTLQALKGRAGFNGTIELKGADIAALGRAHGGSPVANGKMDLRLSLEGQGLSPRGLITVISGQGEMALSKGSIGGLSPVVLKTAASTYLKQEIPDKDKLAARLKGDLRKGRLDYPRVVVPVTVIDGIAKLNLADLRGDDYVAKVDTLLDLGTLRFDSDWTIDPQAKTEDGHALPPVRLTFAGPLAQFSAAEARVDTEEFARFLTMKRMDQDMQKLEKLDPLHAPAVSGPQTSNQRVPPQQPPQPGSETSSVRETGATIPSQSLLRGGPDGSADPSLNGASPSTTAPRNARRARPAPEPAPTAAAAGPASTPATAPIPAPATGWSTGTEAAPAQPGGTQPTPQQSQGQPQTPADFEATIREVLRQQNNRPAYQ